MFPLVSSLSYNSKLQDFITFKFIHNVSAFTCVYEWVCTHACVFTCVHIPWHGSGGLRTIYNLWELVVSPRDKLQAIRLGSRPFPVKPSCWPYAVLFCWSCIDIVVRCCGGKHNRIIILLKCRNFMTHNIIYLGQYSKNS